MSTFPQAMGKRLMAVRKISTIVPHINAATGTLQGDLIGGGPLEWEVHLTGAPVIYGSDMLG